MSSEQRSSSAVRNLRSMFENKASLDTNSPDSRGRSPSGIGSDREDGGVRTTSKVRASFVPVGPPAPGMASAVEVVQNGAAGLALTNGSGSKGTEGPNLGIEKVSKEGDNGNREAVSTPLAKLQEPSQGEKDEAASSRKEDESIANPDKPTTAAEEEPVTLKPAELTDEQAVSGGEALPPVAEDLRSVAPAQASSSSAAGPAAKKATTNGKPGPVSTKSSSKSGPSSVKSPTTPQAPKDSAATRAMTKKASRSSLTAPTAASMARSGGADRSAATKTSPTAATKKREVTKPVSISSHLTAPTASSRAKHEAASALAASTSSMRTSTASRPKPASSAKASSRSSLGPPSHRPHSQTSQSSAPRRSLAPADSSFLERMMKPTAASKAHERNEVKSSPKSKAPAPKPKTNGTAFKTASSKVAPAVPVTAPADTEMANHTQPAENTVASAQAELIEPTSIAEPPSSDPYTMESPITQEVPGNATPIPSTDDAATEAALEATPAGIVSEETIR